MSFARRKKLFVNSQIQGTLLWRAAAFWVVYHLSLWLFLFAIYFVRDQSAYSLRASFSEFVYTQSLLPIVALAAMPIVMWKLLHYSHRVAGPLVQLRNRLQNMATGAPPQKASFRKDDLLTEIETAFNEYVAFLKSQSGEETDAADDADSAESEQKLLSEVEQLSACLDESDVSPAEDRQEAVAASGE